MRILQNKSCRRAVISGVASLLLMSMPVYAEPLQSGEAAIQESAVETGAEAGTEARANTGTGLGTEARANTGTELSTEAGGSSAGDAGSSEGGSGAEENRSLQKAESSAEASAETEAASGPGIEIEEGKKKAAEAEKAASASAQVVSFAMQFLGNPYRYGGVSLTNGADCSGFVMTVYSHFGVSLPHSSAAMNGVGRRVSSLAEAIPGDILVYSGHCGIYLGNGRMLSALNRKRGIAIESATYKSIRSIRRVV